jgi:hypothetical protein
MMKAALLKAQKAFEHIPGDSGVRPSMMYRSPASVLASPEQAPDSVRTSMASHRMELLIIAFSF